MAVCVQVHDTYQRVSMGVEERYCAILLKMYRHGQLHPASHERWTLGPVFRKDGVFVGF